MAEDRIALESKLAVLERTVDALSGELVEHARRLETMQQRLDALVAHVRRQGGDANEPLEPHDTPPPHYGG